LYWGRGWVGVLIQMGLRISGIDCTCTPDWFHILDNTLPFSSLKSKIRGKGEAYYNMAILPGHRYM